MLPANWFRQLRFPIYLAHNRSHIFIGSAAFLPQPIL